MCSMCLRNSKGATATGAEWGERTVAEQGIAMTGGWREVDPGWLADCWKDLSFYSERNEETSQGLEQRIDVIWLKF